MSVHTVNLQRSDGTLLEGITRGSAVAAIVAGAFRAAADIVDLVAVPAGGGARALSTHGYLVFASLELVFGVLVVWGLIGLFEHVDSIDGKQGRGRVVLAGFGLAMFGALMGVGNSWAATFVAPMAAAEAPNLSFVATTGRAPGLLQFAVMLGYVPFLIGMLVFAASALRSRAFPRWQPALLVVALVSNVTLSQVSGSLSEVLPRLLLGVAISSLGYYVIRSLLWSSASTPQRPRGM